MRLSDDPRCDRGRARWYGHLHHTGIYSESLAVAGEVRVLAGNGSCDGPAALGDNVVISDVAPLPVNTPLGGAVEFQQFTFRDSLDSNVTSSGANLWWVRSYSLDLAEHGVSGADGSLILIDSVVWSNTYTGVR